MHIPVNNKDKCVRHLGLSNNKYYLIVLGQAPDLAIVENCNNIKESFSSFGIKGSTY